MKRLLVITLAALMVSPAVFAAQIGTVTLPDSLTAGSDTLLLNGAGFRKKLFIKVYVGGLYLKQKSADAASIIGADAPMAIRMHFVYDGVSSQKLIDGWNEGFANATGGNITPITTEIGQFNAFFKEEAKKNDIYDMVYLPGEGVRVSIKGKVVGTVKGLDFKKALFGIWLGEKPADGKLKNGMLGQ